MSASRALLQHHLRQVALASATLLAGVVIGACGGSSGSADSAAHLLSQTFAANVAKIHSGNLTLTIRADLDGIKRLGGRPLSLALSGPFTDRYGAAPAFDFGAAVTEDGSTLPVSVLSTGKTVYLEFAGTYYALPPSVRSTLAKLVRPSGESVGSANLLTKLGINPVSWLTTPKLVGTTMVSGVETDHLTAQVDVVQLLRDVAKLVTRGSAITGLASLGDALTPTNLGQIASTVTSARVNVYSGASDHILREFSTALTFTIPAAGQRSLDGLSGGSLDLDATITNLNARETITTPSSSEPFSDLLGQSGGLSSF